MVPGPPALAHVADKGPGADTGAQPAGDCARGGCDERRGELLQLAVNDIVIIAGAPGVARDAALPWLRRLRIDRVVGQPEHDDAANAVENMPRMIVSTLARCEIIHLA